MDFEEYVWLLERRVEKETAERVERETAERVEKETAERVARENTIECILEFLEEYGQVSEALRKELAQISDISLLKRYRRLAAKAGSIEAFMAGMDGCSLE